MSKRVRYFILIVCFVCFFFNLGRLLVSNDAIKEADVIVMLLGKIGDRSLQAIDLYKSGYSSKIVFVQNFDSQAVLLKKSGFHISSETDRILEVFRQANIPDTSIIILNDSARNTIDEAKSVARWCEKQKNINRILLVTSSYHSSRAKNVFSRVFKKSELRIDIICPFNKYSSYSKKKWLFNKSDFQTTITESCKWIVFLFWNQWNL